MTNSTTHPNNADTKPVGGEVNPAEIAAPKDAGVFGATVWAPNRADYQDPREILHLITVGRTVKKADRCHRTSTSCGRENLAATVLEWWNYGEDMGKRQACLPKIASLRDVILLMWTVYCDQREDAQFTSQAGCQLNWLKI